MSASLVQPKKKKQALRRGYYRFSDQVKHLKTNVFRSVDKTIAMAPGVYTEGVQSYFQDAFEKHAAANFTDDFHRFACKVRPLITTLPLLIFHKRDVWELVIEHIQIPSNLAVDCLLDLLSALARDLLTEFYPFFMDTLKVVVDLFDLGNAKRLEQCFKCIGYLFKFLRKLLVHDIEPLFFDYYYTILSHRKEFIREFSAESFSFLLRNLKRERVEDFIGSVFSFLNEKAQENQNIEEDEDKVATTKPKVNLLLFTDGIINVLFETMRGVDKGFHSRMSLYLSAILRQFIKHSSSWTFSVFFGLLQKMIQHSDPHHTEELLSILMKFVTFLLQKAPDASAIRNQADVSSSPSSSKKRARNPSQLVDGEQKTLLKNIDYTLEVLHFCVSHRRGTYWIGRISLEEELFRIQAHLVSLVSWDNFSLLSVTLSIISSCSLGIAEQEGVCNLERQLPIFLDNLFHTQNLQSSEVITALCMFLRDMLQLRALFGRICLPKVLLLCEEYIQDHFDTIIHLFLDVVDSTLWNRAAAPSLVRISHQNRISLHATPSESLFLKYLVRHHNQILSGTSSIPSDHLWAIYRVFQFVELPFADARSLLHDSVHVLKQQALDPTERSLETFLLLSEGFRALWKLSRTYKPKELGTYWSLAMEILRIEPCNVHIIRTILEYIKGMEDCPASVLNPSVVRHIKTKENFNTVMGLLQHNLSSCNQSLRIVSYQFLIVMENLVPAQRNRSTLMKFLCLEQVDKKSMKAREATHILSDLEADLPHLQGTEVPLMVHAHLGTLHIKYSLLWPITIKNLSSIAKKQFPILFEILFAFFQQLHDIIVLQSNQVGSQLPSRHILGHKKYKPAGFGITAQNPEAIKTALEQDIAAYEDDALGEWFTKEAQSADKRMGVLRGATDLHTLHSSLWKTFACFPGHIEKISKRIIPFFLSFMEKQFAPSEWRSLTPPHLFDDFVFDVSCSTEESTKLLPGPRLQSTLLDYLRTFGLFKNPRSLKYSDTLRKVYEVLLSFGNPTVQSAAIRCLFGWKLEYLNPYRENIERLVDEKTTREEMTAFNITSEASTIKSHHREGLSRIIIYIMHSKLIAVRRRSKIHRHTILSYLGGFDIEELKPLFSLLLQPFDGFFLCIEEGMALYDVLDSKSKIFRQIQRVSLSRKSKVLALLQEVFKQFGKRMELFIEPVLYVLIGMILWEQTDINVSAHGNIRSACIRRLATLIDLYPNFNYSNGFLTSPFYMMMKERLEHLVGQPKQITPSLELLVAMASSPALLIELHRNDCLWLVLDCIHTKASGAVLSSVLHVVEQLVDLQATLMDDMGHDDILPLYVDVVIQKLDQLELQASSQSQLVERILHLLSRLADYATDPEKATNVLTALLVYLSPSYNYIAIERKQLIFKIISSLQHLVKAPIAIVEALSYQFLTITDPESRTEMIRLLNKLCDRLPQFEKITNLLQAMNSFSTTIIGQYDYETRTGGYMEIKEHCRGVVDGAKPFSPLYYYPLVYHCLYSLKDNDMSIRSNAEEALQYLLQMISSSLKVLKERITLHSGPIMKLQTRIQQFTKVLSHMISPWVRKQIRKSARETKFLREALRLFHYSILYFPSVYMDVQSLVQPQWSFFLQFSSGSSGERLKSIVKLRQLVSPKRASIPFHYNTINQVLIPLLFNQLLAPKGAGALNDEILRCVASLCSHLSWKRYYQQLSTFITQAASATSAQQKQVIKLCCQVLDEFHYLSTSKRAVSDEMDTSDDEEEKPEEVEESNIESNAEILEEELEAAADSDDEDTPTKPTSKPTPKEKKEEEFIIEEKATENDVAIMRALTRQLIPNFLKFMKADKSMISTNIHISLAVVKVVQLLPGSLQRREIPKLFKKIITNLRSRDQATRDDTRKTLLQVLEALGVQHFGLALKELSSTLTRGYQLHILGFSIHFLLFHLHSSNRIPMDSLNHCVPSLSVTLLDDIIGEAGQKKEVQQIRSSMKEARVTKSFESYGIIANYIGFSQHIQDLIHPIYAVLVATTSTKIIKQMSDVLQKIAVGLVKNEKITYNQLLVFLYTIAKDNLQFFKELEAKERNSVGHATGRDFLETPKTSLETMKIQQGPRSLKIARQQAALVNTNLHVLAEFSLSLLFSCLKRNRFDMKDEAQVAMLDPFVPLLVRALGALNEKTLHLSLKCLNLLVRAPLPSLEEYLPLFNEKVFELIQKTSAKSALMGICFKSQIILLRDCAPAPGRIHAITLDDEQIKFLLALADSDLDALENSNLTFSLLKAIIGQKLILPELYDLMKRVSELIVTSGLPSVRQTCLQMFLNFLLYYPLGDLRLQQHLDFILKNLSYYAPDGRQAVLELLHQIIVRFPAEQINGQAEYFFFSLVLCMVNDDDTLCREMAGKVIKTLLSVIDESRFQSVFGLTTKWLQDASNLALQRAAAQLFGLFIESVERSERLPDVLGKLLCKLVDDDEDPDEKEASLVGMPRDWHVVYYILLSIEKLLRAESGILGNNKNSKNFQENLFVLFTKTTKLLLHSHSWIRLLCGRLFGLFFASLKNPKDLRENRSLPFFRFLLTPGIGWHVGRRLCLQLKSGLLSKEDGQQVTRNLLFLSVSLFYNDELHEQAVLPIPASFNVPATRKRIVTAPVNENSSEDEEEEKEKPVQAHKVIHWIFRTLSFAARRLHLQENTFCSILKFYAGMSVQLTGEEYVQFLVPVVSPIYHATVMVRLENDVTELAEEVAELIKNSVGVENYLKAFQTIRKNAEASKLRKKKEQKMAVLLDPETAITERRNARKRAKESQKRKNWAKRGKVPEVPLISDQ